MDTNGPDAIILAAGQGTRMGSDRPKVLVEVAGQPMVRWVVKACRDAGVSRCILVVGYKSSAVRQAMSDVAECVFVEQHEQLGTGHAAQMAEPLFSEPHLQLRVKPGDVFVLAGDGPLIRAETLTRMLETHRATRSAATLATATIDDPDGYGRIVRDRDGAFDCIVEQKDANPQQLHIGEINPSYYCFDGPRLFDTLRRVSSDNKQDEYYLTDVPALLKAAGQRVSLVDVCDTDEVLSINTPQQLTQVDRILRTRLVKAEGPRV